MCCSTNLFDKEFRAQPREHEDATGQPLVKFTVIYTLGLGRYGVKMFNVKRAL